MKDLTKSDFSCWGNGDKYDDELFISHDPKTTAVEIADKILKNQEVFERLKKRIEELKIRIQSFKNKSEWSKIHRELLKNYEDRLQELQKILDGKE